MSFRQHVYTEFAALQTSYTVYKRCYVSRFKGSKREVGHLLLQLHNTMPNPKENFLYCSMHYIIYITFKSLSLYFYGLSQLFIYSWNVVLPAFCSVFLPSPIICPLLFSFFYLFKTLSLCLKCPFFDK
jgi:hypothetical protein